MANSFFFIVFLTFLLSSVQGEKDNDIPRYDYYNYDYGNGNVGGPENEEYEYPEIDPCGDAGCCKFAVSEDYINGEPLTGSCAHNLTCKNQQWVGLATAPSEREQRKLVVANECCYRCTIRDDPHIFTIKGCKFENHLHGCPFVVFQNGLTYSPTFALYAEFKPCNAKTFPGKTCLKKIMYHDNGTVIEFEFTKVNYENKYVYLNNQRIQLTSSPQVFPSTKPYVLMWFENLCLVIVGSSGHLIHFCLKKRQTKESRYLLNLDVYMPRSPSPENAYYGLCGHLGAPNKDQINRAGLPVSCSSGKIRKSDADALNRSWKKNKGDTCLPSPPSGNLRNNEQEDDCNRKERNIVRKRCAHALRKIPLNKEEMDAQVDFCVVDFCALLRTKADESLVEEFLELTKEAVLGTYLAVPHTSDRGEVCSADRLEEFEQEVRRFENRKRQRINNP